VKDIAVIGIPDDKWGEAVHAVVVLRHGQRATEDDLLVWASNKIAGYKRPKSIAFIKEEEMPRTATGKILHRVLRQRYGAEPSSSG
jgi:fatty-acyl-CoA synthase